jgi:hypothetical protein
MLGDLPHRLDGDHVDLAATRCDTGEVKPAAALQRVRRICLTLDDVSERPSHGMPAFFVGKKQFCVFSNDHHGDGRVAIVCAAAEGAQAMLVDSDPDAYYVPPYVGHMGWVGVRLDKRLPWSQIASVIEAGHASRRVIRSTRARRR